MGAYKFILRVLAWIVTILLQIAASLLIILLFTIIFAGVDTTTRLGWLALLFLIWLGYVIGVNLVGYGLLRWAWRIARLLPGQRLAGTMIGALIPLLILLPIGFSVPVGDNGSQFYNLVTNNWQPVLAQVSLFAGILGYYLPGMLRQKTAAPVQ